MAYHAEPAAARRHDLRAGLMTLADFALYVASWRRSARSALAVTTNLNINFLRKPGRAA